LNIFTSPGNKNVNFEVPQSISTLKNGVFGPQNDVVSIGYTGKQIFTKLRVYNLANAKERVCKI
jgi:hypothetical protein